MKGVLRFFNFIIMLVSAAATVLLFVTPSFTFNSNIGISVDTLSQFIPENEYTTEADIPSLLGTNTIHVAIKFDLDFNGISQTMSGDKDKIDEYVISDNVYSIAKTLHEPVDLISEFVIRSSIKKIIKDEVTEQIEKARIEHGSASTAEEIMEESGIDDAFFTNFANELYHAADEEGADVDSITSVLFWQIDEAINIADDTGELDASSFADDKKQEIREQLIGALSTMKLIDENDNLHRISQMQYYYLSDYLYEELQTKVSDPTILERMFGESIPDYADRLLNINVLYLMPEVFYQVVGYTSLALFIGIFVFAAIWAILFLITLIRTFSSTPWTIFGPWFWIIGFIQVVLGVGLTVFGKFILPTIKIPLKNLPINSFVIAPRTYALIPSIIFLGLIVFAIIYAIVRSGAKAEYRAKRRMGGKKFKVKL